jgi:hypothetical protein
LSPIALCLPASLLIHVQKASQVHNFPSATAIRNSMCTLWSLSSHPHHVSF